MNDSLNDTLDLDRIKEAIKLYKIAEDIGYTNWVFCAFGVPGNIFTIVAILTMSKTSSATFLVALLAFYDGLALVAMVISDLLYKYPGYKGHDVCKLYFVPSFLSTMANWALVLIALERYFSVCYPLQKAYLFTKKRSYLIAAVNCVVLFILYSTVFFMAFNVDESGLFCFLDHTSTSIVHTLQLFLPYILSITLTVLIIRGLSSARKERRNMFQVHDEANQSERGGACNDNNRRLLSQTERAERMITIMQILTTTVYVLMTLPINVYCLTLVLKDDLLKQAKWDLFGQCSYVIYNSTHAINFFMYFISAKRFRNHFISLMKCKRFPSMVLAI